MTRDDLDTVIETLRTKHNSADVQDYSGRTYDEHIGYYDKGSSRVACGALRYLQEQGFEIIQAGANYHPGFGEEKGWIEAKR